MNYVMAVYLITIGWLFIAVNNRMACLLGCAVVITGIIMVIYVSAPIEAITTWHTLRAIESNANNIETINERLDVIERVLKDKPIKEVVEICETKQSDE